MYNCIFCSTNNYGVEGVTELSDAKKRGIAFFKGSEIRNKYFDERIGFNNASTGFYDMVQLIYAKSTKSIWINSLDNFCLDWLDLDFLFNAITENDCALYIENDKFSPFTKKRRKQLLELYRNRIRDKASIPQQIGRNKSIDEGKQLAYNSFGYNYKKNEDGTYAISINDAEAKIVKNIFTYYCDGKSLGQIVKLLSGSFTKEKSHFTKQQIKNILSRQEYSGFTYDSNHTKIIKSEIYSSLQIISKTQSDKARLLLRDNSKPRKEPQIRSFYSGLLYCKNCMTPFYIRKPSSLFHKNVKGKKCSNSPKTIDISMVADLLTIAFLKYNDYFYMLENGYRLFISNYPKKRYIPLLWAYFTDQKRELIKKMERNKINQKYIDKKIAQLSLEKRSQMQIVRIRKYVSKYSQAYIEDALAHIPVEYQPAILGNKNGVVKTFIKAMCEKIMIDKGNLVVTFKNGIIPPIEITKRYDKPCWELRVLYFFRNGTPSKYDL